MKYKSSQICRSNTLVVKILLQNQNIRISAGLNIHISVRNYKKIWVFFFFNKTQT